MSHYHKTSGLSKTCEVQPIVYILNSSTATPHSRRISESSAGRTAALDSTGAVNDVEMPMMLFSNGRPLSTKARLMDSIHGHLNSQKMNGYILDILNFRNFSFSRPP